MTTVIIYIVVCLLLSAFFSGMEIAYLSSNKLKLEIDKSESGVTSNLLDIFIGNPGMYITTILVGNNVVMVMYGAKMTEFLGGYLSNYGLTIGFEAFLTTVISTLIILVFAEFLPKAVFRLRPNSLLRFFAVPVFLCYLLFYPISWLSVKIGSVLIRLITGEKTDSHEQNQMFGKVDLNNLIEEAEPENEAKDDDSHEIKLFRNALDFSEIKLRECIVPRPDVVALPVDASLDELLALFVKTGLSRILIFKETVDDIIGYVHSSALFKNPTSIKDMLSDAIIVPESMPALKLLNIFIREHKSLAVVVDEFGITAGIVTMEDIIEEIFGEIEDEHDHQDIIERVLPDGSFLFSGKIEVDYLNEKYHLNLETGDEYETLAGRILYINESIPQKGDVINDGQWSFETIRVENARIEEVRVFRNSNDEDE